MPENRTAEALSAWDLTALEFAVRHMLADGRIESHSAAALLDKLGKADSIVVHYPGGPAPVEIEFLQSVEPLAPIVARALLCIADNGLDAMGGNRPADLLEDNMSWFDRRDLAKWLAGPPSRAVEIMAELERLGLAEDSGEPGPNKPRNAPHDWALSDKGIRVADQLFEREDSRT